MPKCDLCGRDTHDILCPDCLDRLARNADAKQYRLETPRRKRICAKIGQILITMLMLDAGYVAFRQCTGATSWVTQIFISTYWIILTLLNANNLIKERS